MKIQPIYRQFGQNLRFRRLDLGLTQEAMAKRMKISRSSLVNIEQGRQRLLLHDAFRFARMLKIDFQRLVPQTKADREWQNYLDELDGVE